MTGAMAAAGGPHILWSGRCGGMMATDSVPAATEQKGFSGLWRMNIPARYSNDRHRMLCGRAMAGSA